MDTIRFVEEKFGDVILTKTNPDWLPNIGEAVLIEGRTGKVVGLLWDFTDAENLVCTISLELER